MTEDELQDAFRREFEELSTQPPIPIGLHPVTAWCLLAQLQLAFRHPKNTGPAREKAEAFARLLQHEIASSGALALIAERGWDPECDVEWTE